MTGSITNKIYICIKGQLCSYKGLTNVCLSNIKKKFIPLGHQGCHLFPIKLIVIHFVVIVPLSWCEFTSHSFLIYYLQKKNGHCFLFPSFLSSSFFMRNELAVSISSQLTRSSTQLNKLLFKTKLGQRSFYYRTKTLWNALKPIFKVRGISYDF